MKIEVHYLASRHTQFIGTRVTLTLNECAPASLIPIYRIVQGNSRSTIFRHNDKLWMEYPSTGLEKFVYDLRYGLNCEMPDDKIVDDEWISDYLKVGNKLFKQVEEPFYYLMAHQSSVSDMVRVSYTNEAATRNRRHYAPHERERALNHARQIRSMMMADGATETIIWPEHIIEVLNPNGTAKTRLKNRQFQCNHCKAVKFADQAILLDHLSDYHPDLLDEAGYPDEATAEDVIYPNFTEVFWEEDIISEDDMKGTDTSRRKVQCRHCLTLMAADEAIMRNHIKANHPDVHENMQFPFVTTDAFISMNFYEVTPEAPAEKYRCKHCGAIYEFDEENLWGHLQFDHPAIFAEDQDLETPDMIEEHWDMVAGWEVQDNA